MPNISPIGGLSLMVHILINLTVFLYGKTVNFFNLSRENRLARTVSKLYTKEGDTNFRLVFSYIFLTVVISLIGVNAAVVFSFLSGSRDDVASENNGVKLSLVNDAVEFDNSVLNDEAFVRNYTVNVVEDEVVNEPVISKGEASVVDFLNRLGGVDASIENRGVIAYMLGVVDSLDQYQGTLSQNMKIVSILESDSRLLDKVVSNLRK